jgi:acyl carrier protein
MPESTPLQQRIANLFATALNLDVPTMDSDLFDTGVLDSLAFVQLLLHLEEEFGVTTSVDDMEVDNFKSIASIAHFLMARGVDGVAPTSAP